MVGIFSGSSSASIHRRAQSTLDRREVQVPPSSSRSETATVEFKPIEHPMEPLDKDQPIQCPMQEPSILNDGRIWRERVSSRGVQRKADVPVMLRHSTSETEIMERGPRPGPPRNILPSISAPEYSILKLLDE